MTKFQFINDLAKCFLLFVGITIKLLIVSIFQLILFHSNKISYNGRDIVTTDNANVGL